VELLVDAGASAVAPLATLRKLSTSYEARAAAVFALFRIGTPEAREAVRAALSDADFRVRLAAARCVGMSNDREAVDRLMVMARRDHPASRRQANCRARSNRRFARRSGFARRGSKSGGPVCRTLHHLSLITLKQPAPLEQALQSPQLRVRKAALIALDQMDGTPLRREQIEPFLVFAIKTCAPRRCGWPVHPDWAEVVLHYLSARLHDPAPSSAEMDGVRDAVIALIENPEAQQLIAQVMATGATRPADHLFSWTQLMPAR